MFEHKLNFKKAHVCRNHIEILLRRHIVIYNGIDGIRIYRGMFETIYVSGRGGEMLLCMFVTPRDLCQIKGDSLRWFATPIFTFILFISYKPHEKFSKKKKTLRPRRFYYTFIHADTQSRVVFHNETGAIKTLRLRQQFPVRLYRPKSFRYIVVGR